jgi:hypothetical protein
MRWPVEPTRPEAIMRSLSSILLICLAAPGCVETTADQPQPQGEPQTSDEPRRPDPRRPDAPAPGVPGTISLE